MRLDGRVQVFVRRTAVGHAFGRARLGVCKAAGCWAWPLCIEELCHHGHERAAAPTDEVRSFAWVLEFVCSHLHYD